MAGWEDFLDRGVAVATVDAQTRRVVVVAEGYRLFEIDVLARHEGRMGEDPADVTEAFLYAIHHTPHLLLSVCD